MHRAQSGQQQGVMETPSEKRPLDVPATCNVVGRTMGGNEHSFENLPLTSLVVDLKRQVAEVYSVPLFTLRLLADAGSSLDILDDAQTLSEAGLANEDASMVIVRCPGDASEWESLFQTLVMAIARKDGTEARRLVDVGAGFDSDGNVLKLKLCQSEDAGSTMLHLAVREGLRDLALYLIRRGADINCENESKRTPLIQAVVKKQPLVVEALLQARADTDVRDYLGRTALSYSVLQRNDALSATLVATGTYEVQRESFVRMNLRGPEHAGLGEVAPVVCCCAVGMPLTAKAFLDLGEPACWSDCMGRSAVNYARQYRLPDVVAALVERGAQDSTDDTGWLSLLPRMFNFKR